MATFEATRDIRGAAQDPKRAKEKCAKWAYGTRPLYGLRNKNLDLDASVDWSDSQRTKMRPQRSFDNSFSHKNSHNINKPKLVRDVRSNYSRAKVDAMEELTDPALSRSLIELLPSPNRSGRKPQVFVKTNTKETEKLVEKEYEILDNNGDALKGRKARRNLRRGGSAPLAEEPAVVEEDGFELV
ncbi:hypothetical protein G7054_g12811 [Neopestalotiopsis clavispora]|nr:hypothetical protein G7054_g12811 [Neopestalotiopsis clavispora]